MVMASAGRVNAGLFDNPMIGKKAPDFKLALHKGGEASLEDLRKGGKAVIFFWATWCPHCREQLKVISQEKAKMEKLGAAVILVDIGEDKDKIQKFLAAKGLDFDVLMDTNGDVSEMYQVVGIPTIVFVGVDGVIGYSDNGFPEDYQELLK